LYIPLIAARHAKGLKENIAKSEVNPNIIKIVNSDVRPTGVNPNVILN